MPNRNRATTSEAKFHARPVAGGERRPPEHDARQHLARAHDVAHPAARNLEGRVCPGEGAEHPSHLHRIQTQLAAHGRCGRRNGDAIEVGDDRQDGRESEDRVARARRRHGTWCTRYPRARGRYAVVFDRDADAHRLLACQLLGDFGRQAGDTADEEDQSPERPA